MFESVSPSELQLETKVHIQRPALSGKSALVPGDLSKILRIAKIDSVIGAAEEIPLERIVNVVPERRLEPFLDGENLGNTELVPKHTRSGLNVPARLARS